MTRWQYGMVIRSTSTTGPKDARMLIMPEENWLKGRGLMRFLPNEEYWVTVSLDDRELYQATLPGSWEVIDHGHADGD